MKSKTLLPSILGSLALSAILFYLLDKYVSTEGAVFVFPSLGLFLSLFLIGMFWMGRSLAGRPQKFVYTFMGYTGIKMLSGLMFLLILVLLYREYKIALVVSVGSHYLYFTLFEVLILRKFLKQSDG